MLTPFATLAHQPLHRTRSRYMHPIHHLAHSSPSAPSAYIRCHALLHVIRAQGIYVYFTVARDNFYIIIQAWPDGSAPALVQGRPGWLFLIRPEGAQDNFCAREQEAPVFVIKEELL